MEIDWFPQEYCLKTNELPYRKRLTAGFDSTLTFEMLCIFEEYITLYVWVTVAVGLVLGIVMSI